MAVVGTMLYTVAGVAWLVAALAGLVVLFVALGPATTAVGTL